MMGWKLPRLPKLDAKVEAIGWMLDPKLDKVGSLSGEPSGEEARIDGFLANTDKRAAIKTRAERKMAAVREEAAMEGRSRARVTPRVSRGRASTQEERHRRRLRGRAASGTFPSDVAVAGGRNLTDFPGDRKTLSSRSMGTSSSLTKLSLRIGESEQLEGRQSVLPGSKLEHLSWLRFSGPYNMEQNSKSGILGLSWLEQHTSRYDFSKSSGAEPGTRGSSMDEQVLTECAG